MGKQNKKKKQAKIVPISNNEYITQEELINFFKMEPYNLINWCLEELLRYYQEKDIITDYDNYIVAKGTLPVGLCAHIDTVFKTPPKEVIYDPKLKVYMCSQGQGLGADDRAGVAGLFNLLARGYLPTIILCNYEEVGGIGARTLVADAEARPFLEGLNYLIELDRSGSIDCVFYDDENAEFHSYVESFGFVTSIGSFSDISTLCPELGISGVNLSTGYYNEHSRGESLRFDEFLMTVDKMDLMLADIDNIKQPFVFVEADWSIRRRSGFYGRYFDDLSDFDDLWGAYDTKVGQKNAKTTNINLTRPVITTTREEATIVGNGYHAIDASKGLFLNDNNQIIEL